jgi:hypothetical protein
MVLPRLTLPRVYFPRVTLPRMYFPRVTLPHIVITNDTCPHWTLPRVYINASHYDTSPHWSEEALLPRVVPGIQTSIYIDAGKLAHGEVYKILIMQVGWHAVPSRLNTSLLCASKVSLPYRASRDWHIIKVAWFGKKANNTLSRKAADLN